MSAFGETEYGTRRSLVRVSEVLIVVAVVAVAFAASAHATRVTPPRNDSVATPRTISTAPIVIRENTTNATAASSDPKCVQAASVWYSFTPARTIILRVVTVGTSYDSVLAIFRGNPIDKDRIVCNDDLAGLLQAGAQVRFVAGTRYLIAVSRLGPDSLRGGPTTLTLYTPRPFAVMGVTVTKIVAGEVSGRLFVTGHFHCTNPAGVGVGVQASQKIGDHVAQASGSTFVAACTNRPVTWTATLYVTNGWAFAPRAAAFDVGAEGMDGWSDVIVNPPTMYRTIVAGPNR